MAEQVQGGEQQADQIAQYLERVGCPIDGMADVLLPNEAEKTFLSDYLGLRQQWRSDCLTAAEHEAQFVNLMGVHSYDLTKDKGFFQDAKQLGRRYGSTLAGQAAQDSFITMQKAGHELARSLITTKPKEFTSVAQLVWHAVLAEHYSLNNANLNPVEFAYDAFDMLAKANENLGQPLLVVRTRHHHTSDLILVSRSSIEFGEKSIDLIVENGTQIVFEKLERQHYGGGRGLIGGGHDEMEWESISDKNQSGRIVKFERLTVAELVSPEVNPANAKSRFAALSQLVNGDKDTFVDHLAYRPKAGSRSLLHMEEDLPTLAIITGPDIEATLSMLHEQAPDNLRWRQFYGALKRGIDYLFEQQKTDRVAALMEQAGALAVNPLDFYEQPQQG